MWGNSMGSQRGPPMWTPAWGSMVGSQLWPPMWDSSVVLQCGMSVGAPTVGLHWGQCGAESTVGSTRHYTVNCTVRVLLQCGATVWDLIVAPLWDPSCGLQWGVPVWDASCVCCTVYYTVGSTVDFAVLQCGSPVWNPSVGLQCEAPSWAVGP